MELLQSCQSVRRLAAHLRSAGDELLAELHAGARRQEGQTLAEYGILIAVIALIVIAAAVFFGSSISELFSSASKHL